MTLTGTAAPIVPASVVAAPLRVSVPPPPMKLVALGADRAPATSSAKPFMFTSAPGCTVRARIATGAESTGWVATAGMSTLSLAVGRPAGLQLVVVCQSLFCAPVQVRTGTSGGQPITAPLATWVNVPGVAGVGLARLTVRAPLLPAPSVSVALR